MDIQLPDLEGWAFQFPNIAAKKRGKSRESINVLDSAALQASCFIGPVENPVCPGAETKEERGFI